MKGPTWNFLECQWEIVQTGMVMSHSRFNKMDALEHLIKAETLLDIVKKVGNDEEIDILMVEDKIKEFKKELVV